MEETGSFEKLRQAIENSTAYQERLQAMKTEEEAVSALLEIAGAEGIALQRAEIERQIQATRSRMAELSEDELASVSGGYNYNGLNSWFQLIPRDRADGGRLRDPTYGGRLKPL
jgi:bacteriocin-like protein